MAVDINDNVKFKGAFEIDRDYHKNHSKRIVPIALFEYFIKGTKPEYIIRNYLSNSHKITYHPYNNLDNQIYENHGIYDFCIGAKMKGSNKLFKRKHTLDGIKEQPLSKTTRYYVSNDGYELIKKLPPLPVNFLTETDKFREKNPNQTNIFDVVEDVKIEPSDRETNLEAGFLCTVMNKYVKKDNYDINYDYYISECKKIINIIDGQR